MKQLVSRLIFANLLLLTPYFLIRPALAQSANTGWEITSFNSDIILNRNTTVTVTEIIKVDFGSLQKHGIFRTIPTSYRTKSNNTLNIRFRLYWVKDQNDNSIPVSTSHFGDGIKLKIGDSDKTVSGNQTYIIRYSVNQVITRPNELAEFYWNATGNDWPVPINSASVTVIAPQDSIANTICFSGYFGSFSTNCSHRTDGSVASFSATGLNSRQGLTVAVGLNPTAFAFPTKFQRNLMFLQDNWLFGLPLLTLAVMTIIYWTSGRDKKYKHLFDTGGEVQTVGLFDRDVPANVYGPPKDLTPGEVGVLIDEKVHPQDITATMIDLARRGFFSVKELPKKGLFSKPDFELAYKSKDESSLLDFETGVLDMIFDYKRLRQTVKLSKLGKFETAFPSLKRAETKLYDHLVKNGFFYTNPDHVRKFWFTLAGVSAFIGIPFMAFGAIFGTIAGWVTGWLGSGLVIAIFAPFMPARTAKGRKTIREVIGLREWIRLGAWREKIHEKHNFFEEVLPFAIAFGLTEKFIRAFNDAELKDLTKNMTWYQGKSVLSVGNFSSSLGSFTRSTSHTVSWSLPRSAARGGSAFGRGGGGGGFSGGGFGGGGGGSW